MGAALICLNQHRIGHRLMKKNLIADVKSAFPKWLMDLALLIQSENCAGSHTEVERAYTGDT